MNKKPKLEEGVDFYWETVGDIKYRTFTESYLSKRGYCCNNNCKHCPYKKKSEDKK